MEVFDESEKLIGISAYVSKHEGFAAAVKARYSDFIVHEVNIQGEMARLISMENNLKGEDTTTTDNFITDGKRSMTMSEDDLNDPKRKKLNDENHKLPDTPSNLNSSTASLQDIQTKLTHLVGEEIAKQVVELIRHWESCQEEKEEEQDQSNQHAKFITLPLIQDKDTRKEIHMLIKSDLMKPFVVADTLDKHVRIWHRKFEKEMPNYGKFEHNAAHEKRLKDKWPKDRPDYLQFVLYKENIDTATAAKDIARIVKLKSPQGNNPKWKQQKHKGGSMGYAGMKDKRGVTSQFCTVYRKTPEQMMVLNQDRNQGTNKDQHGGGNSNTCGGALMRVGHFRFVESDLRIGSLRGNRFDVVLRNVCLANSMDIPSEEVVTRTTQVLRVAAQSIKDTGFINYFGMQRFGKFIDTHLVGIAALNGNFEEACDIIMRVKSHEHERNVNARTAWANRFVGINMEDERSVKDAEMKAAKSVAAELGRFMNCEQSIVNSLSRFPRDYKRAFGSITRQMRSMFFHAYQSFLWNKMASQRISELGSKDICLGDLVLVEDSDHENSGLKGKVVKEVDQDDIEMCKYKITDVVIPLVGTKVQYPTNTNGTYLDDLLAQDGLSKDSFANVDDQNLVLGGDYRKLICKPSDFDFEIKLYKDPLQPLVQTDLMSLHNVSLDCLDVTNQDDSTLHSNDKLLIGLKIGFTLPPSAYATVLLRELTKRPTSADYQSELLLEGDCEADVGKKTAEKKKTMSKSTKITIGASFK